MGLPGPGFDADKQPGRPHLRGKVPLHYSYEAFGVQEVVTYISGVPAAVLGPVWPVWGSMLGEMPTHAVSKWASDTWLDLAELTRPMRQMCAFSGQAAMDKYAERPTAQRQIPRVARRQARALLPLTFPPIGASDDDS